MRHHRKSKYQTYKDIIILKIIIINQHRAPVICGDADTIVELESIERMGNF